jgi:hypothetical protein
MGISGNETTDGLTRQVLESGTVHEQITIANDPRILPRQAMGVNMVGGQETLPLADLLI